MPPDAPLPHHGRYDYLPITRRTHPAWPDGRRLAVYVAVNHEHFAFGEGLGAELAPGGPQPDILNYAWRDWGNRVGAWRLLALLDELALPASVLVNAAIYGHCPELMAAHRVRGDEVVGHGRSNAERQGGLDEAAEAELIGAATDAIHAHEGRPPTGWLGPWISESPITPDLLAEAGYRYVLDWCMDDQPIWLRCRGDRRILAVPYPQEVNDIPAIVARKDGPRQFADMIIDAFDEMREQAQAVPLVFGIALHPYIIGQPHRLRQLRRALTHVAQARSDVWITTAGRIADYSAAVAA